MKQPKSVQRSAIAKQVDMAIKVEERITVRILKELEILKKQISN